MKLLACLRWPGRRPFVGIELLELAAVEEVGEARRLLSERRRRVPSSRQEEGSLKMEVRRRKSPPIVGKQREESWVGVVRVWAREGAADLRLRRGRRPWNQLEELDSMVVSSTAGSENRVGGEL